MTLKEVVLKGESWRIQQNLDWERTRYLAAITKNAGIVARGGSVSRLDEPRDLFSLPQDSLISSSVGKPKSTVEQAKKFLERARKAGVKFGEIPKKLR